MKKTQNSEPNQNLEQLFTPNSEGLFFYCKVTPKASQNKIGKIMRVEKTSKDSHDRFMIKIYVRTAPEDGKANQAVIDLLAKEWHLKKSQIVIKQGFTEPFKKIQILGEADLLLEHFKK